MLLFLVLPGCGATREERIAAVRARLAEDIRFLIQEVGVPLTDAAVRAAVDEALKK